MTRLDQALRWWRGRKCECGFEECGELHSKMVLERSVPQRHFHVLHKTGRLHYTTATTISLKDDFDPSYGVL